jgi:hypothetical protein
MKIQATREPNNVALKALADSAGRMRELFELLTKAQNHFMDTYGRSLPGLAVEMSDGIVIATFAETKLTFNLSLGFGDNERPTARVICLREHSAMGQLQHDYLGAFRFDQSGTTNLVSSNGGMVLSMHGDADGIVLHFMEQALKANGQMPHA